MTLNYIRIGHPQNTKQTEDFRTSSPSGSRTGDHGWSDPSSYSKRQANSRQKTGGVFEVAKDLCALRIMALMRCIANVQNQGTEWSFDWVFDGFSFG